MTQKEPTRPEPSNVILEGVVGSTAYGLATPESDIDRRGIFVEPVTTLLSLGGLPVKKQAWVGSKSQGDRELTEVGKFCSLVLGGNPTYTELLWLPEYITLEPLGEELIGRRELFLSARAAQDSYFGYAVQQFVKLERRDGRSFSADTAKRTEKHARHMARLLFQGFQLWATGRVIVKLPPRVAAQCRAFGELVAAPAEEFDARLWDRLKEPETLGSWMAGLRDRAPRNGIELAQVKLRHYERLFDDTPTVLPVEPNREAVDAWLTSSRLAQAKML